MKLSRQVFEKSGFWMRRNGRPLEMARWAYLFEGDSKSNVIYFLSAFQNEDGGFGHGIEPDFWLPKSSSMATWVAGQILMEINAQPNEKIVRSMIDYLINTYNHNTGMWDSVLPENNHYPHAPWWNWQEGIQKSWMFNPSVELAAFLVYWLPEASKGAKLGWNTIKKAIYHVMDVNQMDRHEINNYQNSIKILQAYEKAFNSHIEYSLYQVSEKILKLAEECIEKDTNLWKTGYKPLPLDFIDNPNHPLCERLGSLVKLNLDFYIKELTDEGYWDISWDWGNFPDEFPIARRYWQSTLTVNRYKALKSFGYIE